jgi:FkbM family methyltransferase
VVENSSIMSPAVLFQRLARPPGRLALAALTAASAALARRLGIETIATHTLVPGCLDGTSVLVDLGAHEGAFSRILLERTGCRAYGVEASPALAERLARWDDPRWSVLHGAVGGDDGPVELHLSTNPQANSVFGAVSRHGAGRSASSARVPGYTLERLLETWDLERVDLLKVDVEGAELALFDAAGDGLLRRCRQVTVEFHDFVPALGLGPAVERLRRRFRGLGFAEVRASRPRGDHSDVLFLHPDLVSAPVRWGLRALAGLLALEARLRRLAQRGAPPAETVP